MSRDINFVTFICPVTFIVTFMMSSDVNFVTFMMFSDLFVRHPCRVGVPWDVTVSRRLSRVFVFRSVGSFRGNILADAEFVFFVFMLGNFGKFVLCSDKLNKHTLIYSIVV